MTGASPHLTKEVNDVTNASLQPPEEGHNIARTVLTRSRCFLQKNTDPSSCMFITELYTDPQVINEEEKDQIETLLQFQGKWKAVEKLLKCIELRGEDGLIRLISAYEAVSSPAVAEHLRQELQKEKRNSSSEKPILCSTV